MNRSSAILRIVADGVGRPGRWTMPHAHGTGRKQSRGALVALVALAGALAPLGTATTPAGAAVPTGDPVFTAPLLVDNPYAPFKPGTYKVYSGHEGREKVTVLESHLQETRTFTWRSLEVTCRTVREQNFVGGVPVETSHTWLAQADDGSVYVFGETTTAAPAADDDGDGDGDDAGDTQDADDKDTSWVVGAVAPEDPPETISHPEPFLWMPAEPRPGDSWKPEDIPGVIDETLVVLSDSARTRVLAGRYPDCLAIAHTSELSRGREVKFVAPGVGVVRTRSRDERVQLQASTLRRR
jgi:hypothetical protein